MSVSDHVRHPASLEGVEVTAPSGGLLRGAFYFAQDTYGIVYQAIAAAVKGIIHFRCNRIMIPKSVGSGLGITAGDKLYLNISTLVVSSTQGSGNLQVGIALEDAAATDTTVEAYLDTVRS